jgi:RNA polymerase sigma factor (sigma-70 family)
MARQTAVPTRRPTASQLEESVETKPPRRRTGETTGQHQFALAYNRLREQLFNIAHAMLGKGSSPDEAEDVVQDAVAKYLEQRDRAKSTISGNEQDARLVLMVGDLARDRTRKRQREARLRVDVSGTTAAARRWSSARLRAEDADIAAEIRRAVNALADCYRLPWCLVHDEGLDYDSAAAELGITPSSLRAYLTRANRKLQVALAKRGITPQTLRGRADA